MRRINQRAMSHVVIWFLGITSSRCRPKADCEIALHLTTPFAFDVTSHLHSL